MKVLITGAAGFVGSSLAEALLSLGHEVIGLDALTDYYDSEIKKSNITAARDHSAYTFLNENILTADLESILDDVEIVYHQAAQPGVRASWGEQFSVYTENNVLATQLLLDACRKRPIKLFVYASSSSIYGDAECYPTPENVIPRPISPYGVTKLAAEHLCNLYRTQYGVPTTSLRYFTVYGPRQSPDMAFHRFIRAVLKGDVLKVFGSGGQKRDFTYIADAVAANIAVMEKGIVGETMNIGGGSSVTVNETIALIETITGNKALVNRVDTQKGDVMDTAADTSKARNLLGFTPKTNLNEGLKKQIEWIASNPLL